MSFKLKSKKLCAYLAQSFFDFVLSFLTNSKKNVKI